MDKHAGKRASGQGGKQAEEVRKRETSRQAGMQVDMQAGWRAGQIRKLAGAPASRRAGERASKQARTRRAPGKQAGNLAVGRADERSLTSTHARPRGEMRDHCVNYSSFLC